MSSSGGLIRRAVRLATFAVFALATILYARAFTLTAGGTLWTVRLDWLRTIRAELHFGVDGSSLGLAWLATLLAFVAALASDSVPRAGKSWFALLLLLEAAVLAALASLDLFLFAACFELALVLAYGLVHAGGGERAAAAAGKLALTGLLGSLPLWLAVVALRLEGGTFSIPALVELARAGRLTGAHLPGGGTLFGAPFPAWCFACLCAAFGARLALVPLHRWLVEALAEAPAPAALLLAGPVSGLGGFGLLHVAFPLFPEVARASAFALGAVGALTAAWAALAALAQSDLRRLAAWLAVGLGGLVLLGSAADAGSGRGATLILVHRALAPALLLLAFGAAPNPSRALAVVALLAALLAPGTSGFVPAWLTVAGAFQAQDPRLHVLGGVACASFVVVAAALLRAGRGARFDDRAAGGQGTTAFALLAIACVVAGVLPFLLSDPWSASFAGRLWSAP